MAKFIEEFKEFAFKGNVMDMAVGVIIGGAFGKIVSSVVGDLIMPLIAAAWGVNVSDLKIELKPGVPEKANEAGEVIEEAIEAVTWNYGAFIQNVLDFFIIAICLFLLIKGIAKLSALRKKKEAEEAAAEPAPEPTKEEVLLTEIRDLFISLFFSQSISFLNQSLHCQNRGDAPCHIPRRTDLGQHHVSSHQPAGTNAHLPSEKGHHPSTLAYAGS